VVITHTPLPEETNLHSSSCQFFAFSCFLKGMVSVGLLTPCVLQMKHKHMFWLEMFKLNVPNVYLMPEHTRSMYD
jgi:hypothetical protein